MLKRKAPPDFYNSFRAAQQRAKKMMLGIQEGSSKTTIEPSFSGSDSTASGHVVSPPASAVPFTEESVSRREPTDGVSPNVGPTSRNFTPSLGNFSLRLQEQEQPLLADDIPRGLLGDLNVSVLKSIERPVESGVTKDVSETSVTAFQESETLNRHPADAVAGSTWQSKSKSVELFGETKSTSAGPLDIAQHVPSPNFDVFRRSNGSQSPDKMLLDNIPAKPDYDVFLAPEADPISIDDLPPFLEVAQKKAELVALEAEVQTLRASEEGHKRTIQHLKQKLVDAEPQRAAEIQQLRRQIRQLSDVAKAREAERVERVEEVRRHSRQAQELAADLTNEHKRVAALNGDLQRCKISKARAERAQEEALRDARALRKAAWNLLEIDGVEGMVLSGFGDVGKALMVLVQVVERVGVECW